MSYLAIDIGASSGRHIVGDIVDGKLVCEEIYRFPNGAIRRDDGSMVWEHERLFAEVLNGLKEAKTRGKTIDYIAIDTWGVDYALLDDEDKIIGDLRCYRDARGEKATAKVHDLIPFEELYRHIGIQFAPFNTIYQLYDDVCTGKLAKAKTFLMLPDYLNFLLTGVKKQEYTNATTTGLLNAKTHDWDEEIFRKLGLPREIFLSPTQPSSVVGPLKKEIAELLGYEATVLLPATHDTASAILAAPIAFGEPYLSSGTWSLLGVEEKSAHTEDLAREYNYSNEGSVNYSFRFQKNIVGLWMIQQVRHELNDAYSFAEIARLAAENPTEKTLNVEDPCFLAPVSMIEEIKKQIGDVPLGELFYSVYRSLALCYRDSLRQLESLTGKTYESLHIVGGGANNRLLNELTAKECGIPVYAGPSEATAIGNLLAQLLATKTIDNIEEGRKLVASSFPLDEVR